MKNFILVSGGSGYIGSNLIKNLLKKNYYVINIDIKKTSFSHKNLVKITIDLNNYNLIYKSLKKYSISHIYHFAATSDIDFSVDNPKKTLNNNIFPTYNLLKIAELKKTKRFFFASTIYTNSSQGSYYRISKYCSEEIINEFYKLHGINFTIIRFGSLFGDLKFKNTINNLITSGQTNKAYHRQGSGKEIRNYIDIEDACEISASMIKKKNIKKYYNIIGKEPYSFKQIFKILKEYIPNLDVKYSKIDNNHHYIKTPFDKNIIKVHNISINKKNYFINSIKKYIDHH